MTGKNSKNSAIDKAIEVLEDKLAVDQDMRQLVEDLKAMKGFDRNLGTLGRAIVEIRNDAEKCRHFLKTAGVVPNELACLIEKIRNTADSLHNVPTFMLVGIPCDAQYLYFHGVDKNWPTGMPNDARIPVVIQN